MIHMILVMGMMALLHICCFAVMSEPRYSPKKTAVIYAGFWFIFILETLIVYMTMGLNSEYTVQTAYGSTIVMAFVMFILTSADPFSKKLFLFINYSSVFCILLCVSMLVFNNLTDTFTGFSIMYGRSILRAVLYGLLIFVYYKFFRQHVRAISGGKKETWHSITFVSALFLMVFTTFVMVLYRGGISNVNDVVLFIMAVTVYCSVLWVIFRTIRYMSDENKMELAGRNVEYLREQLDFVRKKEMEAKTVRHDMRHHNRNLIKLLSDGKVDEAIRYVKQYDDSLKRLKSVEFCPHTTVNAILSDFYDRAINEGIHVSVSADIPEETSVNELDYVAIISNILENAVNACRKYKPLGNITVDIRTVAGKTVIVCSNPCGSDVIIENGMIKDRGTGIYSILLSVKKYNGDIRYTLEKNILTVCIILNN